MRTTSKPIAVGLHLQGTRLEDQISLETEAIELGVARYKKLAKEAVDRGDGAALKPAERLLLYWLPPLVEAIRNEQQECMLGKAGLGRHIYGPVVSMCPAEKIAVVTMHEMLGLCMRDMFGVLVPKLAYAIGNGVVAEIHHEMLKKTAKASLKDLDKRFKNKTVTRVNWWAKNTLDNPVWNRKVCVHLGTKMIYLALDLARVNGFDDDTMAPAFAHQKVWRDNQKKGVVKLTDEALVVIEDGHLHRQHLRPRFMPMLVEPYKWKEGAEQDGGYIQVRTPFMCKPTNEQTAAVKNAEPELLYEALNAINSVPWSTNTYSLAVMDMAWDQGGGLPGVPTADLRPMPKKPANIATSESSRKKWKREAHDVYGHNAKLRGARVEFIQTIELARRMAKEGKFWLPHQYDFRYRFYPIPIWLNHHGADPARGLLLAGNRVPLTDRGRWWIKVHAANKFGYDKTDFESRVNFIDSKMNELESVYKDPLKYVDVWSEADDPWQFLSAISAMFNDDIGERFFCQSDGTANGIQHYCAAGLDEVGGRAVNLVPGNSPNDLYTDVLMAVVDRVRFDIKNRHDVASGVIDYLTHPDMGRSIVKQPVMTVPYNVTRVGARDQVQGKLQKLGFQKKGIFKASDYLATTIFDSVGDVCVSAREIMKWIEDSVRLMAKHDRSRSIRWTSPMGGPVVQPYRNFHKHKIETVLQWVTLADRDTAAPISVRRQIQGGPPNVIHTWDGGHAQGTSLECHDEGIDAAFVHDGYWFHANNMDQGNHILRKQFVLLHKDDQIGRLYQEWSEAYPDLDLPSTPKKGLLDLDDIMNSEYFFN